MSDISSPNGDQALDALLNQDVGAWSAATGVAGPGANLVQGWVAANGGGGTLAEQLAIQAENVGYYASHAQGLPQTSATAIRQQAMADPRWGQLDVNGQNALLQLYNLQAMGYGGNIGTNTPLPGETPGPTGTTGIGAAPGVNANGLTTDQQSAWDQIKTTLQQFGFSPADVSSLTAWAKQEIVSGNSPAQISLDMMQTQPFLNRFPGIALRQQAGLPPITPAQYLQLEDSYTQILRQSGLPVGFYDQPQDLAQMIGADVSPSELQDRITNAYDAVNNAPQEVQQAFGQFYGPTGQAALAAYVIDPSRAEPALLKQVQAAQFSGAGAQYGFHFNQTQAERAAALGIDQNQAQAGFKEASQFQSLVHGEIGEKNPLGEQGVTAGEFGLNPGANVQLQQALLGRQADFSGSGQGLQTNTGLSGLGSARSI